MRVIVDTGIFFAFYSLRDKHHYDSLGLISHLVQGKWSKAFITNHILDKTLNILRYRLGTDTLKAFIEVFIDKGLIEISYTDSDIEEKALKIFRRNIERKGLSYTDATTVAIIDIYSIDYLLTTISDPFKD